MWFAAITFPAPHDFVQHQHQKEIPVSISFRKKTICHTIELLPIRIAVKQKASFVFQLIKRITDRNDIAADCKRVIAGKIQKIIFVTRERLLVVFCGGIGSHDGASRGNTLCILVDAALHLFRNCGQGIGTMIFTKIQEDTCMKIGYYII